MEKIKRYGSTFFAAEILQEAVGLIDRLSGGGGLRYAPLRVEVDGSSWEHDEIEEFWADYRRGTSGVGFSVAAQNNSNMRLWLFVYGQGNRRDSAVHVEAPTRAEIERVSRVFEQSVQSSKLPDEPVQAGGKIFIGHGRSLLWRELHDHLRDLHGFDVEAYEVGARAGHAVRDVLESMLTSSSMAFLVMTGEDETADDNIRARQNVVHELGLFQGKLGFPRGIALVEEGTELFTNMAGIQQIRFSKGNIKETFGEVVATIRRETG